MTSPNTIIADLAAEVEALRRQRDKAVSALVAFRDGGPDGGQDFKGWHDAYLPAVKKALEAIAESQTC